MKICIIAHARMGKDTLAEIWRDNFGLSFQSSSQAAAEIFLYKELKDKYNYTSPEECFEDRINHRPEWHNMICDYNKEDKARLAKEILKDNDCYVGMRSSEEIAECRRQGLFDLIVWVDASKRVPPESKNSMDIVIEDADIIIQNNGTLEEFTEKAIRLGQQLYKIIS